MADKLYIAPKSEILFTNGNPKYRLVHKDGCGQVAFYFFSKPETGQIIKNTDVLLPNGNHPNVGERIICWNCKRPVMLNPSFLEEND